MISLDMDNSRMKDFYDLWYLSRHFEFEGRQLTAAVRATFGRRNTLLLPDIPVALTSAFSDDGAKQAQWNAFLRKSSLVNKGLSLPTTVDALRAFLLPVLIAAREGGEIEQTWTAESGWN